jgi:hypothetical protein
MNSPTLPNLDGLADLGSRGGVDMRPTLIRVLTDLYVQKLTHTPDEERHYTELALRLLDAVDVPTRTAVATRLVRHLSPPLRVIQRLAADLPDVAAPVRGHRLLETPAKSDEPVRHRPVAPIAAESPTPEDRDQDVHPAAPGVGTISADIAGELNELFFAADANERRLILLNLEVVAPTPAGRIGIARDAFIGQELEAAALTRNREDFSRTLAHSLHIPIVAAAKALNIPREALYRILLFVNTAIGHSVERVHALAALYDELSLQTAEHMVAIWQGLNKTPRTMGRHQPMFGNDKERVRARPAAATARRAPIAPRTSARRDAS